MPTDMGWTCRFKIYTINKLVRGGKYITRIDRSLTVRKKWDEESKRYALRPRGSNSLGMCVADRWGWGRDWNRDVPHRLSRVRLIWSQRGTVSIKCTLLKQTFGLVCLSWSLTFVRVKHSSRAKDVYFWQGSRALKETIGKHLMSILNSLIIPELCSIFGWTRCFE